MLKKQDINNEIKAGVGKKIRIARQKVKMSQTQLGKSLIPKRTHAAISDIERGVSGISITDLSQISDILGEPLSFFLVGMPSVSMTNFRYSKDTTKAELEESKQVVKKFDEFLEDLIIKEEL